MEVQIRSCEPENFKALLEQLISIGDASLVAIYIERVSNESLGLALNRLAIQEAARIFKAASLDPLVKKQIFEHARMFLAPRSVAFEQEIGVFNEQLAEIYEASEDWATAARVLQSIPLESGHRTIELAYKCGIYIRIVQLLLEDDDSVNAEAYMNRAALIIPDVQDEVLQLQFLGCQARCFDFRRQFLPAASKYLELSNNIKLNEVEQVSCLIRAVTCAILAGAGPARSRLLGIMFKDDRIHDRAELRLNDLGTLLQKMHLGHICRPEKVELFRKSLMPHQNAILSDGQTVLDRSVVEHNILAASKVYQSISLSELGTILNVHREMAEEIVCRMIMEERVQGSIDQITDILRFDKNNQEFEKWDNEIREICHEVDSLVSLIKTE